MIVLESAVGSHILLKGRKYHYFGGNDYLGLANHPGIKEAVIRAVKKFGVNFSAARGTSGTATIHHELETELSEFKGKQDSVIFASGYQGNGILLDVLKDRYECIVADRFAHPSILSAIPRDVKFLFYDHLDAGHLERILRKTGKPLVVTDGIFALTGEIAPLDKIFPIVKKYNGILVADDAHSTGILGKTGKGTPEFFNLPGDALVFQTETMSKALGSYGGFISGDKDLITRIRETSAVYQASTSLPPPLVAAGLASLKIIRENPDMHIRLLQKAVMLKKEISQLGFQTTIHETPIIPLTMPSCESAINLNQFLESEGFIVPYMNYPHKDEKHLLRIALTLNHSDEQLNLLIGILGRWLKSSKFSLR